MLGYAERLYPRKPRKISALVGRVKSDKFGNQVKFGHTFANRVNPDETVPYEPSHQDFHCLLSKFIFIPIFEI